VLTVSFKDHSEDVTAKLRRKVFAAVKVSARTLADGYRKALQEKKAPPHSSIGEIPAAYLGWKPGGFGPTNPTLINNIPPEFAAVQTEFLSEYIVSGFVEEFGGQGFVGFSSDGHVANRSQNYLIYWDQFGGRPWIYPVYQQEKNQMIQAARAEFEGTE
jgi:hypothetical protein